MIFSKVDKVFLIGVAISTLLPILSQGLVAQSLTLLKSTYGVGGGSAVLHGEGVMVSHTIGQSSPIQNGSFGSTHILQGFQHLLMPNSRENGINIAITISPNPSAGKFTLEWPDVVYEKVGISIFDLNGNKVFERKHTRNGRTSVFELLDLPDGVYLVQVSGEKTRPVSLSIILRQ